MIQKILSVLFIAAIAGLAATCHVPASHTPSKVDDRLLLGSFQRSELELEPYCEWYQEYYEAYMVDSASVAGIAEDILELRFVLALGTWCGDTKRGIPPIFKILDWAGVPQTQVQLIGLDRKKTGPNDEQEKYHIRYTPTLIVLREQEELGRIVETPVESWEEDLARIVRGEPYTPNHSLDDGDD